MPGIAPGALGTVSVLVVQGLLLANKLLESPRVPSCPTPVCPGLEIFQSSALSECPSVVREELAEWRLERAFCSEAPSTVSTCPAVVREELSELRRERATEQSERGVDPNVFAAVVAGWVINSVLALCACCRRYAPVRREGQRNRGGGILD